MPLRSLIVHKIDKEPNHNPEATFRENIIPVGDRENQFVENIRQSYYKRSNPLYGVFDRNSVTYPFQTMLREHIEGRTTFYDFSVAAMHHLVASMDHPQATGGYVLFAIYTEQGQEFALVVILNDQKAYNISDTLDVQEILSIAVDKLDVANAVNLTRWNDGEIRYLSFVKGRKEISDYFLHFIGCTTNVDAKQSSRVFEDAFRRFLAGQNLPLNEEEQIRNDVYNYCHQQIARGAEISLNHVSTIIDQNQPDLFSQFARGEEYGVSPTFTGHEATLKNLKFFTFTGGGLSIKFNRGEWVDQIRYDANDNTLTIRQVPDALRQRLEDMGII